MSIRYQLGLTGIAVMLSAGAIAEDSVEDRATEVKSRLEVLNSLGRDCESHLQVDGMEGASSPACAKYLRNVQGDYLQFIGDECNGLNAWFASQQQMIRDNPSYPEDPARATQLLAEMKSVKSTCDTDDWRITHRYILKPLSTIDALSKLE